MLLRKFKNARVPRGQSQNIRTNFSMTLALRQSFTSPSLLRLGSLSFPQLLALSLIAILCISAQGVRDYPKRDIQDVQEPSDNGCPSSSSPSSGQSCPSPRVNSQPSPHPPGSNSSRFTFTISPSVFDVDLRPCSVCVAAAPSSVSFF